jgi:hypothetical protein
MRGITRRARTHHTMAEIYIPTEQYRAAVNAIAALTGIDTDDVKVALGEEANTWPASIRAHVEVWATLNK